MKPLTEVNGSYPDMAGLAVDIANDLSWILEGRPKVAAFLAIGMVLGFMEMETRFPDRARTFELLGRGMDQEIARRRAGHRPEAEDTRSFPQRVVDAARAAGIEVPEQQEAVEPIPLKRPPAKRKETVEDEPA